MAAVALARAVALAGSVALAGATAATTRSGRNALLEPFQLEIQMPHSFSPPLFVDLQDRSASEAHSR